MYTRIRFLVHFSLSAQSPFFTTVNQELIFGKYSHTTCQKYQLKWHRWIANQSAGFVHTRSIWDNRCEQRKVNLILFRFTCFLLVCIDMIHLPDVSFALFSIYSANVVTQKLIKMHYSQLCRVLTKWYRQYWNEFWKRK